MPSYTCLVIGPSNAVVESSSVDAANSAEALDRVEHALRYRVDLTAIEIWYKGRMEMRFTLNDLARQMGAI
jgi:hypothetical protein